MKLGFKIPIFILAAGCLGLTAFETVAYVRRDKNSLYDAVSVSSNDFREEKKMDLGTMVPGQMVPYTLKIASKIEESVDVDVSFSLAEGTSELLASLLDVKVIQGEDAFAGNLLSLSKSQEKYSFSLGGKEETEVTFQYTLENRDGVPLSTSLDFAVRLHAESSPIFL